MTRVNIWALLGVTISVCAVVGLARSRPTPWLINETPSLPRGVYLRMSASPALGTVVAVAPPQAARSYLASLGAPPNARLLKRVVAGPGETVCRKGQFLIWPRGEVVALDHDRHGRPLPVWRGCRPLATDERLVLGDSANSFDSRYFGPVKRDRIEGVYREAWLW